jgi:hypothetical protein
MQTATATCYLLLLITAIPKTRIHRIMTVTHTSNPRPTAINMNILAFLEASMAPAISPADIFPLTCAAKIIDTTPTGKQQKIVARIAGIK